MKYLFPILLVIFLTGCSISSNPLGTTSREQIRANAAVAIAEADERARIAEAEYEAEAIIAKHSVWADVVPTALVIIGAIVIGSFWLNWRGRYALKALELTPPVVQMSQPALPTVGELRRLATSQGYSLQVQDNVAYLMDGDEVKGRRRLTG